MVAWLVDIFSVAVGIAKLYKGKFYGDLKTRKMLISYVYLMV